MQNLTLTESITLSSFSDMDYFINTLTSFKAKGLSPELIGSHITHYATKWLPELSEEDDPTPHKASPNTNSITTLWIKKKLLIENLIQIIPTGKEYSISCNFLLRLLRLANMVNVEETYRYELEEHIASSLDQASLKELMIPSFSHRCSTLLDFELVLRLVKRFVGLIDVGKTGTAVIKVAKLVDCYLAEAALDTHLSLVEFVELASVLPSHARYSDDALYRAIDTYLKAHPGLSKQDRKRLFYLIDSRKLSQEASLHAAQNERLPVRAVIQVLLSEQVKLSKHVIDWSGSLIGACSPGMGLDFPARSLSKREMIMQNMEIKRLKEDVLRLQSQCMNMEKQIDKLLLKKKGFFRGFVTWKKSKNIGIITGFEGNKSAKNKWSESFA